MVVPGNIHNRVHVVWLSEAVPQANEEKREATSTASLEKMVYADPLSAQVSTFRRCASFSKVSLKEHHTYDHCTQKQWFLDVITSVTWTMNTHYEQSHYELC